MSRIAGYIHWCSISSDSSRAVVSECLRHMTGLTGSLLGSSWGDFGFQGSSGGIAQLRQSVLVLDGLLLDRKNIDDGGSGSDADLLLRLCKRVGFEKTLELIDGDIALAFFDGDAQRIWLSRDRFGVKPLYYAETSRGVIFSSLPAPLARLDEVDGSVNRRYVSLVAGSHYRTFDNGVSDSPFKGVRQIPAASLLSRRCNERSRVVKYWQLLARDLGKADEHLLAEQYRELLFNAVDRRLSVADKPAFTLSGGMDSSSVLCVARQIAGIPQVAFSSVYSDPTFDESAEIRDIIDAGVAKWNPIEISDDTDVLDQIARLVRVHNEPVATATWLAHDAICGEVAKAGYGSLFSGLGGDELNAGEYEYFPLLFADIEASGDSELLEQEIAAWAHHHNHPIHRKTRAIALDMMQSLTIRGSPGHCLPDLKRQNRYLSAINPDWFDLASFIPVMEHPFEGFLANRAYQDLTRETTPCCLRAEDRQCRAHGLEHFDPFLDRELVEFMFSVPATLKIRNGITKHLLRNATIGLLPDKTRLRIKKTGWNAPAHLWFSSRRGLEALSDIVGSSTFRNRGLYNVNKVEKLIAEHRRIVADGAVRENHMMFLWQLMNVDCWLNWVDQGLPELNAKAIDSCE